MCLPKFIFPSNVFLLDNFNQNRTFSLASNINIIYGVKQVVRVEKWFWWHIDRFCFVLYFAVSVRPTECLAFGEYIKVIEVEVGMWWIWRVSKYIDTRNSIYLGDLYHLLSIYTIYIHNVVVRVHILLTFFLLCSILLQDNVFFLFRNLMMFWVAYLNKKEHVCKVQRKKKNYDLMNNKLFNA